MSNALKNNLVDNMVIGEGGRRIGSQMIPLL